MSEPSTAEQLLADAAWLRRLALTLAGNETDADDLVQESWIAAWRRQPDTDRPLRPWLAKVVRDVAGMKRRSERRRAVREEVASSPVDDAGAPPDALLDQMRLHRLIVDLVLELEEPYRATIIARFVEGRTAAAIARSAGIPESTVRGRIRDGLARLRDGLDRARGERSKWAPAVLAFAKGGIQVAKPTKSILVLVGLVLLLVGGGVALFVKNRHRDASKPAGGTSVAGGGGTARDGEAGEMLTQSTPAPSWFAPRGVAGRRVAGHVTYLGRPIKDATVALQSMFTRASAGDPDEMSQTMQGLMKHAGVLRPAVIHTGADGRFDFGMLPPASYEVTAIIEGKTAAIAHVNLADPTLKPPSEALELRLKDCTASVAGTVYDASENPLPKARVLLGALVGVETDAHGSYKMCVPYSEVMIEYSADGYGAVRLTIDGRGEVLRDVVLVPEATVTVRVLRADTGELVPDAHVNVYPQEFGPDRAAPQTGITDVEGRVRIDGLVPGRYRIGGFADGLQTFSPIEALVEVGVGTEAVLRLDPSARITGKVVDGGKPVAGAYVSVARKSPAARSAPRVSQLDGSFTLDRVPPGDGVFIAPPYEVETPAAFHSEPGKTYDGVVIDIRPSAVVRGIVTRLGKPVEGVGVCCVRTSTGAMSVNTDAEGHYKFEGVVPGTYDVQAGSDEVGAFKLPTKVTIAAGEEKVLDHELDMAGAISGTVVDKEGKPVKGVYVRWMNEKTGDQGRATTDAQGRYRCGAMTGGGVYRAAVFPSSVLNVPYPTVDGSPYPTIEVKDGKTEIDNIRISIDRPALALGGQVIDDAGNPVSDAVIRALPSAGGAPPQFHSWLRLPMTSTDGEGKFRIPDLAPGNYAVQARASDGAEGVVPPVAAGTNGITIRIERAGSIEGTLVGFSQPPVVYARTFGEWKLLPGSVDGASFRVTGVHAGKYLVNAQTTFEGDAHVVDVRAGQVTKVVMTSHGQGTIEGTVLDFRTKKPIANASCHTVMAVDGEQSVTNWDLSSVPKSDASGRVLLDPAPAGTVNVNCQMPGLRWSNPSADVTLAAGGRATVQLYSAELTSENPSSVGLDFDWRVTAPRVVGVKPNSPAAKAGILAGDVITEVNGTPVQGLNAMGVAWLIGSVPAGSEVRLVVQRGTSAKSFTLKTVADAM
ncbi:MAG: sigma-70 family RNA polymerase sigma factor [Kofleriaceae bacterium]|nr:sigma-70 family RNA polymerase sigma factor [Kofleriaceae bacterium]